MEWTLDVAAGARYLDVDQSVNWNINETSGSIPIPDRTGTATADLANWDAIIGAKRTVRLWRPTCLVRALLPLIWGCRRLRLHVARHCGIGLRVSLG